MTMIIMTTFLHDYDQCKDDHVSEEEGPAGDQSTPTIASSAAAKNPDNPEK